METSLSKKRCNTRPRSWVANVLGAPRSSAEYRRAAWIPPVAKSRVEGAKNCDSVRNVIQVACNVCAVALLAACSWACGTATALAQPLSADEWQRIRSAEEQRIAAIDSVMGSVVAIYDWDRQGGGSGVIIDPSGIAVTNHHVIMGAGVRGWGGLADGQLYEWDLIGSDPGGDVAVIHLRGRESFPCAHWGNSDLVRVGDWAMAMGNPFVLSEDHAPTITLGIVSGVQRFQSGAGQNELVYGNCIQIDSSINPGNSGGPLFNRFGQIIGINGRASFLDRGRVNVGLGYAISSNQVINFLPDLLATKLARHGTLDASFGPYGGRVLCTTINEDAPVARGGLSLGDELLAFEGVPIVSANQFLNLICTLPEGWPAVLTVRKSDGTERTIVSRLLGLPYQRPNQPPRNEPPEKGPPDERQRRQQELQQEMMALLSAEQGKVRKLDVNRQYVVWLWQRLWASDAERDARGAGVCINDDLLRDGQVVGRAETTLLKDGRWQLDWHDTGHRRTFWFDGQGHFTRVDEATRPLTLAEAKLVWEINATWGLALVNIPEYRMVLGTETLEGSDKAAGLPAFRLKFVDPDRDWFFAWLTGLNPMSNIHRIELTKMAPDQDCDRTAGGVTFAAWSNCDGWQLPSRRTHIRSLLETEQFEMRLREWQLLSEPIEIGAKE